MLKGEIFVVDNKLENLFSELNQEEISKLNSSDVDMSCELDEQVILRICGNVKAKIENKFNQR